ncbi:MAG: radical SAM protein [Clostridia bacterium]|nr:radical SAM protein [Clostridia bacterium]
MEKCNLCPRICNKDRAVSVGFCGQTNEIRVARAAPHYWEEPCLSGKNGSGTVFFCGCTLGCVYCQNAAISRGNTAEHGITVTEEHLAEIFLKLQAQGVNNINLVTPTMFAPQIKKAVSIARKAGLTLPIVYNTSGYERVESLGEIADMIDVYLPDFKYLSPELSEKYSRAADYPENAAKSLEYMVNKIGAAEFTDDGIMTRGVIVRHLLLPGQLAESIRVIDYLFEKYGNSICYSLMSQYTPLDSLDKERHPELSRKVTTYEYNKLIDHALSIGMKNAFIQQGGAAKESFIPTFNGEGV